MQSHEPPTGQVPGSNGGNGGTGLSDGPGTSQGGKGPRLDRAARSWVKRGYSVRYRDPYLIQLAKRRRTELWPLVPLAALGVAAVMLIISLARRLLRERWHVVELTETPDKRIITHRMWAPRPPND